MRILSKENASRMLEARVLNRFGNEEAYQRAVQTKDRMTFRVFWDSYVKALKLDTGPGGSTRRTS